MSLFAFKAEWLFSAAYYQIGGDTSKQLSKIQYKTNKIRTFNHHEFSFIIIGNLILLIHCFCEY